MTREEAIYCMKSYIDNPNYEHCTSCPYYGTNQIGENVFVCKSSEAHKMAVEALEQINKINKIAHIRSVEDLNGLNCEEAILGLFKTVLEENLVEKQEPCTDVITISRQALEDAIANTIVNGESLGYAVACDILSDLPPVTPAEKVGHWIDIQYFKADDTYYRPKCPFCSIEPKEYSNYCPNCGAKMSASPIGTEGSE